MMNSIDTAAKRAKLRARKNPYWRGVSGGRGGVSLGYRKSAKGAGSWIAKIVLDGVRSEERIGGADDTRAEAGALSFADAVTAVLAWGRQQFNMIEARRDDETAANVPTVKSAVLDYIEFRKQRSGHSGRDAGNRLSRHVLSDKTLSETRLSRLRATALDEWRSRLPKELSASTKNRLLNDLRAALNSAVEKHRRELPAHILSEIRAGTKAGSVTSEGRRQLLDEKQVCKVVDAAFEVDPSGDFGRLVLIAAATGGRFSQIAALKVADVQFENSRIMMPASKKGRGGKPRRFNAIPVAPDILARLAPVVKRRNSEEFLLLRWTYKRSGGLNWSKDRRRPWGSAYEIESFWPAAIARAGVPQDTVMYALRHSSIVRGLRSGLPVRLVAVMHDTSIEMIEAHYAAFIIDMTEDLARRSMISFSAPQLQAAE